MVTVIALSHRYIAIVIMYDFLEEVKLHCMFFFYSKSRHAIKTVAS